MKNRKASVLALASQDWAEAFSFQLVTVLTPATDTRLRGILLKIRNSSMPDRFAYKSTDYKISFNGDLVRAAHVNVLSAQHL